MIDCYIEKIKARHNCYTCHKQLFKGYDRVHFQGHNYCLSCGYESIKKSMNGYNNVLIELEEKYGKEIVIARLSK